MVPVGCVPPASVAVSVIASPTSDVAGTLLLIVVAERTVSASRGWPRWW